MYEVTICRLFSFYLSTIISFFIIAASLLPIKKYFKSKLIFFKYFTIFLFLWGSAIGVSAIGNFFIYINYQSYIEGYRQFHQPYIIPLSFFFSSLAMKYYIKFFRSLINTEPEPKINSFLKFIEKTLLILAFGIIITPLISYTITIILISLQTLISILFFFYEIKISRLLMKNLPVNSKIFNTERKGLEFVSWSGFWSSMAMLNYIFHEIWKEVSLNNSDNCSIFWIVALITSLISIIYILKGYAFPLEIFFEYVNIAKKQKDPQARINTLLIIAKLFKYLKNTNVVNKLANEILLIDPKGMKSVNDILNLINNVSLENSNKNQKIEIEFNKNKLSPTKKYKNKENDVNNLRTHKNISFNNEKGTKFVENKKNNLKIKKEKYSKEENEKNKKISSELKENIEIIIFAKGGIQILEYGNKALLAGLDSQLLGGLMSAFQSFSLEIHNDPLKAIILEKTKFLLYSKNEFSFFIIAICPTYVSEEKINRILSKIGEEFEKEYGQDFKLKMNITREFVPFIKKIKEIVEIED